MCEFPQNTKSEEDGEMLARIIMTIYALTEMISIKDQPMISTKEFAFGSI